MSKVVRAGTTTSKAKAQRYRCFPADGSPAHSFTPPVARRHVHHGDERCDLCERLRGDHQGEPTGGRYYRYGDTVVAGVLQRVGMGATYAEASQWARRQVAGPGRVVSKDNGLAIGMVEAFSHVVWDPLAGALVNAERDTRQRRRRGEDVPPSVLVVDDVWFVNRSGSGFHCLVIADTTWGRNDHGQDVPRTRLRLVRAMATKDTSAWAVTLSEVGAPPDYLIADGASAIAAGIRLAFPDAEDDEITNLPSLWHVQRNLHEAFFQRQSRTGDKGTGWDARSFPDLPGPVANHLRRLPSRSGALGSPEAFDVWWDQLEAMFIRWGVPQDIITTQRATHYDRVAAAVGHLAEHPFLPASTGAVESLIRDRVKPFFHNRSHSFANLERTNRALNLLVARDRGALDDTNAIARAIRADLAAHDGRAIGQRTMDDTHFVDASGVVKYSSLRDPALVDEIARRRLAR